jgi:Holliday junction DNA helicase RuvB
VEGEGKLDRRMVDLTLTRLEVDANGLDAMDRRILACVIDTFGGGPVGIEAVAASVGEEAGTIEDVYEPFLVREGYLARSPRGRVALPAAYQHLGKAKAGGRQGGLF